ncbi:helix-turn-helix transcriptional regulator [Tenacibaculum tangerinum]|uniref:Helix-turn-helix transcriptional regulator n=1 Tax=Tenacibaculum tangerinum TaxID=3038772 RepID=A0ABY8L1P6_9FLAO|nr:helix-turn-helix transcriptional regulator [Tenacibaculum tangerinum]WGH75371.1 helix-turn-helix transcriptional regulator [Tenacibaculum tangerinum]
MKTITINTESIGKTFSQLHKQLSASYEKCFKEHCLTFNNTLGRGEVRGILLQNNISYLEFNVQFEEDVALIVNGIVSKTVNIAYCSGGSVSHQFSSTSKEVTLEPFKTAIVSNVNSQSNTIYFKKDTPTTITLISAYKLDEGYANTTVQKQLFNTFINNKKENTVFLTSNNLEVAEKIAQLSSYNEKGIVRSLLVEGMVHIILALQIQHYRRDVMNLNTNKGSLTSSEMEEIKELSMFIKNYPEEANTIEDLCRKTGLTASKLQEGFKLMHNTTVNDFIRDERIRKSEKLIKNSDLNISQIVYSIGFSSRSYFCKIFKQKYNCTPTQYKLKTKLAATA